MSRSINGDGGIGTLVNTTLSYTTCKSLWWQIFHIYTKQCCQHTFFYQCKRGKKMKNKNIIAKICSRDHSARSKHDDSIPTSPPRNHPHNPQCTVHRPLKQSLSTAKHGNNNN